MSIEIIGSNGQKIKLITEDKINSIIQEKEISYNLYKKKYINKHDENHLIKQCIKLFYKYDEYKSTDYNFYTFNKFLKKINKTKNIIDHINIFYYQNNLFDKLNNSIIQILKEIFNEYNIEHIELNNNFYLDLLIIIHLLKNNNKIKKTVEYEELLFNLEKNIKILSDYITTIQILKIKENHIIFEEDKKIDIKVMILILDNYIQNITFIKGNILKIDSIINIIIEDIYKFYKYYKK